VALRFGDHNRGMSEYRETLIEGAHVGSRSGDAAESPTQGRGALVICTCLCVLSGFIVVIELAKANGNTSNCTWDDSKRHYSDKRGNYCTP
jgi:hypothetical protein